MGVLGFCFLSNRGQGGSQTCLIDWDGNRTSLGDMKADSTDWRGAGLTGRWGSELEEIYKETTEHRLRVYKVQGLGSRVYRV